MRPIRVDLSLPAIRKLGWGLTGLNLVFTAGTALFIYEWDRLAQHGRLGRAVIAYLLVQLHLATENGVAAWYSSMLLLSVALAALLAFSTEQARRPRLLSWGWIVIAAVFAGLSLDEMGSFHERLGMLHRQGTATAGWVYVLIVPILAVALFMLVFAWSHLRRVPAAAVLFAAGTLLFLSDPALELAEMALLRVHAGSDLAIHNALLVLEEGPVELGGASCFLFGVLVYTRRTAGDGPHEIRLSGAWTPIVLATAALLMTAGVPAAHWFVAQLPPADTGIPDDWFPAAVLYLDALVLAGAYGRRALAPALALTACSAAFGAALYGYLGWFQRIGYPGVPLCAGGTALASIGLLTMTMVMWGAPEGAPMDRRLTNRPSPSP